MASIIIPAHNEENVIARCLRPLIEAVENNQIEVIVVCNGCNDLTARIVTQLCNKFICIETDKASKANALNLGDQAAQLYPRIYLDADVSLSVETISALTNALDISCFAVAPEVKMNMLDSSWMVRAYYDVWLSLPYCKAGLMGSGVYALSEEGRSRFDLFPNLIADDGYVRCLFNESERGVASGYYSVVTAPRNISGLIKIKTRSRLGVYQLKQKFPDLMKNEEKDYKGAIGEIFFTIKLWPKLFIYLMVNLISRARAQRQVKNKVLSWERDDSSRLNS